MKADEIKDKKRRLEEDLHTLIRDFEEATGTHVERVSLTHARSYDDGPKTKTVAVEAEVQL